MVIVEKIWVISTPLIIAIETRVSMVIVHIIEHILDGPHAYHKRNNRKEKAALISTIEK